MNCLCWRVVVQILFAATVVRRKMDEWSEKIVLIIKCLYILFFSRCYCCCCCVMCACSFVRLRQRRPRQKKLFCTNIMQFAYFVGGGLMCAPHLGKRMASFIIPANNKIYVEWPSRRADTDAERTNFHMNLYKKLMRSNWYLAIGTGRT